jgi:hypothetical protein
VTKPIDLKQAREKRVDRYQLVPCARCGRDIPMHSRRCPRCGVYFSGEAFQFTYNPSGVDSRGFGLRRFALGLLAGAAIVLALAFLLTR